jgi:hypothetical protein
MYLEQLLLREARLGIFRFLLLLQMKKADRLVRAMTLILSMTTF